MTNNYSIFLKVISILFCAIVTGILFFLIFKLIKQRYLLIKTGAYDDKIKKEYVANNKNKKENKILNVVGIIVNVIASLLVIVFFAFSIYVQCVNNNKVVSGTSLPKVVMSGSMSYKNESNKYLVENKLDNQFQTYDVLLIDSLPDEFSLKQYDIVVYEIDNTMIIHRIINIEEPNESHPEHRLFQLKGDANNAVDKKLVSYDQMKGIYKGTRIPFVGIFVSFAQSYFGILCFSVIAGYLLIMPRVEKKMDKTERERLLAIGFIDSEGNVIDYSNELNEKNSDSEESSLNEKEA